jgi:hypothetical protein
LLLLAAVALAAWLRCAVSGPGVGGGALDPPPQALSTRQVANSVFDAVAMGSSGGLFPAVLPAARCRIVSPS